MQNLRIDQERLWQSLMAMAEIGATEKGGVEAAGAHRSRSRRPRPLRALVQGGGLHRHASTAWATSSPAAPAGAADLPPVVTGSHLDTQPTGGRFDGVYGVLAGLEVVRTLNDLGYETEAPIEVVVWTNEEGARFAPAMVGSGVFAGVFDEAYGHSRADLDGKTIGEELKRIGYLGPEHGRRAQARRLFRGAYRAGTDPRSRGQDRSASSRASRAIRWFEITVTGSESHAGTTPMNRAQAMRCSAARASSIASTSIALAHPPGVSTVGIVQIGPELAQHHPRQRLLHRRFAPPARRDAGSDEGRVGSRDR